MKLISLSTVQYLVRKLCELSVCFHPMNSSKNSFLVMCVVVVCRQVALLSSGQPLM